jgi:hypothetical protein
VDGITVPKKTNGGVDVQAHVLLTLTFIGSVWSAYAPVALASEIEPPTLQSLRRRLHDDIYGEVVEVAVHDFTGVETGALSRPARSQSLYRMRYRGS